MGESTTIIAALKFQGGVVIGADSQASDPVANVRWPVDKLECLPGGHPCVIGFGGSMGKAQQARDALEAKPLHDSQFKKRELARNALDRCLATIYQDIKKKNPQQTSPIWKITLVGLGALWTEDEGQILEFEYNGDSCFHSNFHAIGSGADTAYAVYRTLGGTRLSDLDEPKALLALIRIMRTCVNVEMQGVSEPVWFWIVGPNGARCASPDELQPQIQMVDKWEQLEQEAFFNDRWSLSD